MNALFNAIDSHPVASILIVIVAIGFVWMYIEVSNTPFIDNEDNF